MKTNKFFDKDQKPESIEDYKLWINSLRSKDPIDFNIYSNYYNSVMDSIEKQFLGSNFWYNFSNKFENFNSDYYSKSNYQLLTSEKPKIFTKSFDSFLYKTFRKNVIFNDNWPNPPTKYNDWIFPENWFRLINDILRTTIVVKYLDGVEFILEKLKEETITQNLPFYFDYEAKEEGYYAVHTYTTMNFEIPDLSWTTKMTEIKVEIQITTQIKDVIRKLTHNFYEKSRNIVDRTDNNKVWQWNYSDEKFTANYLGHILHYLEGMIMEIRNKKDRKI